MLLGEKTTHQLAIHRKNFKFENELCRIRLHTLAHKKERARNTLTEIMFVCKQLCFQEVGKKLGKLGKATGM